jgi:thioredoxin reductase
MAIGITGFPYVPTQFASVPSHLVSHSSAHKSFDRFTGRNVIVIGKGQSALESAALMHECGAHVEIITRGPTINYIRMKKGRITSIPTIHQFLYPPTDLAGPPHNWAIADPAIYRTLSKSAQAKLFELIGPIGSTNLEARLAGVPAATRVEVTQIWEQGDKVHLELSDGTIREVDHVLLATGFRPDINQCEILSDELRAAIEQEDGYPKLTLGYESTTVKGLYITGALAGRSQGPITRFVCGTYPLRQYLTEAITGSRIGYPDEGTSRLVTSRRLLYRAYQLANSLIGQ